MNRNSAAFGNPDDYAQTRQGQSEQFMNKSAVANQSKQGVVTPTGEKRTDTVDYFDKSEAEYGRQSTVQNKNATQQNFFEQERPSQGKVDNYTRQAEDDHEYNPTPVQDESGRSVSSEGDIANHNPFNSIVDRIPQGKKTERDRQDEKRRPSASREPADHAVEEKVSPNRRPKKTIIYSDKSESSIDEMMGDTPSNYNIPNGRLDGKSLGLKAILLHAKQHGNSTTIDPPSGNNLGVVKENPMSPQANPNSYFSNPNRGGLVSSGQLQMAGGYGN